MNNFSVIDPSPDWTRHKTDLLCPLCEYNLRGLDQPRCPECGFAFQWSELIRGQEEKHPYLFEHQNKRNIWSFLETYCSDCIPQKFWGELSPAQPVYVGRLILYWMISNSLVFLAMMMPVIWNLWNSINGSHFTFTFSRNPASLADRILDGLWTCTLNGGHVTLICSALGVLGWPWMTLIFLLVFVQSMRKANIKKRHVFRAVIYGSDCTFLMMIFLLAGFAADYGSGYPLLVAVVCSGVTLYRTSIAYRKYLRFHLPFATVLTSQFIALMIFVIVYVNGLKHW